MDDKKPTIKKVETRDDEQKLTRRTCHICFGMGVKEKPNGDTIDCPNRACNNGYILVKTK